MTLAVWCIDLDAGMIADGRLQMLISAGVRGLTAARGTEKAALATLDACAPCHERFVACTPPREAGDAESLTAWITATRALLLYPGFMVHLPATPDGMRALRSAVASGVSVGVDADLDATEDAMRGYIEGLEERSARGFPLFNVRCSLFSRVRDERAEERVEAFFAQSQAFRRLRVRGARLPLPAMGLSCERILTGAGTVAKVGRRYAELGAEGMREVGVIAEAQIESDSRKVVAGRNDAMESGSQAQTLDVGAERDADVAVKNARSGVRTERADLRDVA